MSELFLNFHATKITLIFLTKLHFFFFVKYLNNSKRKPNKKDFLIRVVKLKIFLIYLRLFF